MRPPPEKVMVSVDALLIPTNALYVPLLRAVKATFAAFEPAEADALATQPAEADFAWSDSVLLSRVATPAESFKVAVILVGV